MINAKDILQFWFETITPKEWYKKNPEFDQDLTRRFGDLLERASRAELFTWRESPEGRLAEIIVLDQFSRNIYRDSPAAFAQDTLALALSQEAVRSGCLKQLNSAQQAFMLMPYMHSESVLIHEEAITLFGLPGLEDNLRFEHRHKDIIDRFGRYPHRNKTLNRNSTEAELIFLNTPGSSF